MNGLGPQLRLIALAIIAAGAWLLIIWITR